MTSEVNLTSIEDPAQVEQIANSVRMMLDRSDHLNVEWLSTRHWFAVPVESASHFNEAEAERISSSFRSLGVHQIIALATEELQNQPLCYLVSASKAGLMLFSRECGHFNYILTTVNHDAAVLCTSNDYYIVAGPERLVLEALGTRIENARKNFLAFATDEAWPPHIRKNLLAVHDRYRQFKLDSEDKHGG
jgi:hypothetical protein